MGLGFLTEVLHMPEDRLWASIYEEDEEAYSIPKDVIGLDKHKIVRLGKEDNF